ncbi:MAG: DUF1320 family protein [Geobacteraceae bacterium]|nr:DUF1320 family protein [Geobacteraceae bacterium]
MASYTVYATVRDLQRHFSYSSLQKLSQQEEPGQDVNGVNIPVDPEGSADQLFADLSDPTHQELLEDLIKSACTKINRALRPRYGSNYILPFTFPASHEDDTTETLKRWAVAFAAQELMNRPGAKLEPGQRTFLMMHYDECKGELDRVSQSIDDLDMANATTVSSSTSTVISTSYGTDYGAAFGETIRTGNNEVMI